MEIFIGNLLPNKNLEIKTIYVQKIISEDMSYCFKIIQSYPKIFCLNEKNLYYENYMKGIKCNIYLSTKSQLTRFIILNKRKDINYFTDISDTLTFIKINFEKIYNKKYFKSLNYSCLKILFRTENVNFPILYVQYDENKNETSYLINYIYSNIQIPSKFSQINSNDESKLQFFSAENFQKYHIIINME